VFELTQTGRSLVEALGINVDSLIDGERVFTRQCPDWSQPKPHLGGALGAALFETFCKMGWTKPVRGSRAVTVTRSGRTALNQTFDINLPNGA
jgi:hypothetical protein